MRSTLVATLIAVAGFFAAELSAVADDDNPQQCKCEILRCTDESSMVHTSGPCAQRCPDGMKPACQCGKCTDKGMLEKPNVCSCKRG